MTPNWTASFWTITLLLLQTAAISTVILVATAGAVRMARRASAATRHRLWLTAVVACLATPLVLACLPVRNLHVTPDVDEPSSPAIAETIPQPAAEPTLLDESAAFDDMPHQDFMAATMPAAVPHDDVEPAATKKRSAAPIDEPPSTSIVPRRSFSFYEQLATFAANVSASSIPLWTVGVWSAIAAVLLARIAVAWLLTRRLIGRSEECTDTAAVRLLEALCGEMTIRRPVKIRFSREIDVPMLAGFLRPQILLPAEAAASPRERLSIVLRHELAHVARRDLLTQLLADATTAVGWFQPLLWHAARRLRVEREIACDDLVLGAGAPPCEYADELLSVAARTMRPRPSLVTVTMAGRSTVEHRIRSILNPHAKRQPLTRRATACISAIAAIVLITAAYLTPTVAVEPMVPEARGENMDDSPDSASANQGLSSQKPLSSSIKPSQDFVAQVDVTSDVNGDDLTSSSPAVVAKKAVPSEDSNPSFLDSVLWQLEDVLEPTAPVQRQYVFRVETNDGRPISGATVTFNGFGLPGGSSVGGLRLTALVPTAKSDADGNVRINLSRVKSMFSRARHIFLKVDHPDYPPVLKSVWIADAPKPGIRKIVLAPSRTVEIRAHRQDDGAPLRGLYPQLRGAEGNWSEADGVLTIRRLDLSSDKASRWLRIVHAPPEGSAQFSELIDLEKHKDSLTAIAVAMKPSVGIAGRLSDEVPRPVKNGRVIAAIYSGPDDRDTVFWGASAAISADGTFVIENLPPDEDVQLIVLCDGWVSQSPTHDEIERYVETYGLDLPPRFLQDYVRNGMFCPRLHRLSVPSSETIIPMERTSACEVTVVDAKKKPVPDAKVVFYPRQTFFRGHTFELGTGWNVLANVQAELATGKPDRGSSSKPSFEAITNTKGVAFVSDLAGGEFRTGKGSQYRIRVEHPDYLPQYEFVPSVTLKPGETGSVTVKLVATEGTGTSLISTSNESSDNPVDAIAAAVAEETSPSSETTEEKNKFDAAPKGFRKMLVRTIDQTGEAVPDTRIYVSIWPEGPYETSTQDYYTVENGQAVVLMPDPPRLVRIWTQKDGYVPLFTQWWPKEQPDGHLIPEEFTFTLPKGTEIGGVVVNDAGELIKDAIVEVRLTNEFDERGRRPVPSIWLAEVPSPGKNPCVTDENGRWSLNNVPAGEDIEVSVKLTHPDYVSDLVWGGLQEEQGVSMDSYRNKTATLTMHNGHVITGTITDPNGNPVSNAVVVWGDDPYSDTGSQEVLTDRNGIYRFPPLPIGEMTVTVVAKGWAPHLEKITIVPDPKPVDVQLQHGSTIRIRLVDDAGKPIPNVQVSIKGWRGSKSLYNYKHPNVIETQIPRTSDENGMYQWNWAPLDEVTFTFHKEGFHYFPIHSDGKPLKADNLIYEIGLAREKLNRRGR